MKANTFDKKFDNNQDISEILDRSNTKRPNQQQKRVNVDFPIGMIDSLDAIAKHLGLTRLSIIKMWLAERLEKVSANKFSE